MTIMALSDCCRHLGIDPKTLRRWLSQAQLKAQPHPGDRREKGITADHLRLLATAHHRSLPALPAALLSLPETLDALQTQLAALQQQVAALTRLLQPPPLQPALPAVSARHPTAARRTPQPPRKPAHVIPRVEYGREGHYLVICPKHGLLPFEPDTPEWFAWLDIVSSFRFVGKAGHFTAHHESLRVPHGAWRAHRTIRNHNHPVRLALTHDLTIAVLEQAAAALQAHLM